MSDDRRVRLATWNCRQGIDRKRLALDALGADVVVIPECGERPALASELGVSFLWRGDYAPKGLAVVGLGGWQVEPLDEPTPLPWVLPVRIVDPQGAHAADLLAVWPVTRPDGRPRYEGQIAQVLDVWADTLAAGNTIVAGDFNCSLQGKSTSGHRKNLIRFSELGLASGYHASTALEHGSEAAMTLTWVGPGRISSGYHCDFVFLPLPLLERLQSTTVGWTDEANVALSDHLPVVVELST